MKRFSWLSFVLAALLHFYGTNMLFSAGMQEHRAIDYGATPQHEIALKVWAWVWLPVPMVLKPLFEHHGPPSHEWPPPSRLQYFIYLAMSWSLVVGIICGFLDPCISRWRCRNA